MAGAAGQYVLVTAEFVAVTQVLVYIGAIVVLFLFGIMLTQARMGEALAEQASAHARVAVDAGFVRAVKEPPGGRLNRVVLERLAAELGGEPGEIRRALFQRRGG